jgi:hypothetical protein
MTKIILGPQLQPHHHKLCEIFARAEKNIAEQDKQLQNPPKKPA